MGLVSSFNRLTRIKKALAVMALVVLIYAVFGFFIAPVILKNQLISVVSEQLGRKTTVDKIKVNPFALSVTVTGFELGDPNGEKLFGFEQLFINFQLSSMLQRTYIFDEIRLDAPEVRAEILPDKTFNFSDLLVASESSEPKKVQGRGVPPVRILRLRLDQGRILFSDLSLPTPYKTEIFPLTVAMDDFSTRKDAAGPYSFTASFREGGQIRWEGSLSVNPVHSEGHFALTDFNRRLLYEYFQDRVRFDMHRGSADLSGRYLFDAADDAVHFELIDTDLQISGLSLAEKGVEKTLIAIPLLSVKQANVDFSKKEAVIGQIAANDAGIEGWLDADGEVNFQTLFASKQQTSKPDNNVSSTAAASDGEGRSWQVLVNDVKLKNFEVLFEDQTPHKPVRFLLKPLDIHMQHLSSQKNARFEIELNGVANQTGNISIKGNTRIHPVSADLDIQVSGLDLPAFQPYIDAFARLDVVSGAAGLKGRATFRDTGQDGPEFRYKGQASIDGFKADNRLHHDDFLKWTSLSIKDITLELKPNRLHIEEIVAKQPFAKVIIGPDRTVNLVNVFRSTSATKDRVHAEHEKTESMPISIRQISIADGSANFADRSLKPNFATGIQEMNGTIKGLSSQSLTRADLLIEGKVDRYAPVRIAGQINPLSEDKYTDLELFFKNIELTTFTPYSGKFAGYQVEKGKMSLDLKYKLSKKILIGENEIFLNQLTLGERVDSPQATSLPVRLAVALLKDGKGNIDIDLPVRGNINDPEFSLGHIILKAFVNLITKIVTSPFAALGSIVGGDGETLGFIEFESGQTVLGNDQTKKLDKLAEALNDRPALALEIKGISDQKSDWKTLAERELRHRLQGIKIDEMRAAGQSLPKDRETFTLSDEDYRRLLVKAYEKVFDERPGEWVDTTSKKSSRGEGIEQGTDPAMLMVQAQERLIKAMPVDEAKLHQLAVQRSKRIFNYMVEKGNISDERLFIVDVEIIEAGGEKVRTNLKLSGL